MQTLNNLIHFPRTLKGFPQSARTRLGYGELVLWNQARGGLYGPGIMSVLWNLTSGSWKVNSNHLVLIFALADNRMYFKFLMQK